LDKARVETIRDLATDDEKAKLGLLYNATIKCLKEYESGGSAPRLRDWQAAEGALETLVEELETRYLSKPAAFDTLMDAVRYLKAEGYKVGKSTLFYARKAGKLEVKADGSVLESDLLSYAVKAGLKKVKSGKNDAKTDEIYEEKAKEELELTRARREKIEFETQKDKGLYTKTDEVLLAVAVKIAVLEASWKNMVRVNAEEWLQRSNGRGGLLKELIYADFDKLLDDFGNMPEVNVLIKRAESGK
jgi:hypothetical protein